MLTRNRVPSSTWFLVSLLLVLLVPNAATAASRGFVWVANLDGASISKIDKGTDEVVSTIGVPGRTPCCVAVDHDSVWVVDGRNGAVLRINKTTDAVVATISSIGTNTVGVAADENFVWVGGNDDGNLYKIDKTTNKVVATIPIGQTIPYAGHVAYVALDQDSVWVTGFGTYCCGKVWKVDKASDVLIATISLSGDERIQPQGIAVDADSVWVAAADTDVLMRIDKNTNALEKIAVGSHPFGVAQDAESLWVTNINSSTVSRIRTLDRTVTATISGGSSLLGLAVDDDAVWVASYDTGELLKVSKAANSIVATIAVGHHPFGVATEVVTPAEQIDDLLVSVRDLELPRGIDTSLIAKLKSALAAIAEGDTATACDSLNGFIHEVAAQSGKKIPAAAAKELIIAATGIRTALHC